MKNSRKGITPVVATVLLLTISVAATASAYTFITDAQEQIASNTQDDLREQERIQRSDINIEYVYNGTGQSNFTFMNIRNTGSLTLAINESGRKTLRLYADGIPVESEVGSSGQGWKYPDGEEQIRSERVELDPEDVLTINTTVTYPVEGDRKTFRLTGPHETTDSHICYNTGSASC